MTALITMYAGEAEVLRAVSLPTFQRYADRCDFELIEAQPVQGLPPAWGKVGALIEALEDHPLAIWIDADAVIFDSAPDLAEWMPNEAHQLFAYHQHLQWGLNTWLWGVRSTPRGLAMLDRVWERADRFQDPPWELAAVAEVMGEHPVHQLGFVRAGGWNGPTDHLLHESNGNAARPYVERATQLRKALEQRATRRRKENE